jgi:hypothetical protein
MLNTESTCFNLTTVREASKSFQSPFYIKSLVFEELIRQHKSLTYKFEVIREKLLKGLFELIENTLDDSVRQKIINIKRSVYNKKELKRPLDINIPKIIDFDLNVYTKKLEELKYIFATDDIKKEIEHVFGELLELEEFRVALNYSCPHLSISKIKSYNKLSDWLQAYSTLYSYALKHVTKTPPLFTYSKISLSEKYGVIAESSIETVLNVELISEIEKSFLKTLDFNLNIRLLLAPVWQVNNLYFFLLIDECDVRIKKYQTTPLLAKLIYVFKNSAAKDSSILQKDIYDLLSDINHREATELIENLKRDEIVTETLIEDVENPIESLVYQQKEKNKALEELWKCHGEIVNLSQFYSGHRKINASIINLDIKISRPYFAYNYGGHINPIHQHISRNFVSDLSEIKEIMMINDTNYTQNLHLKMTIQECFEQKPNTRMLFPELISRVLYKTLQQEKDAAPLIETEERFKIIKSVKDKISTLSGIIQNSHLDFLKKDLPKDIYQGKSISFVGNVDFSSPRFYIHNIFEGNSRFSTKYLIKEDTLFKQTETDADFLDVEIIPVWNIPQHRVRKSYQIGFSFDARCRTLFQNFVNFDEIEVGWEEKPLFYHTKTGKRLNFHYRGLALLRRLSIPYKILLSDHIDFFNNIFDDKPPECSREQIVLRDEVKFGSLCLRRSCVCVGVELLKLILLEKEWLKAAFLFRKFLKYECQIESDELYFRLVKEGDYVSTPRYLNLLHPLSWNILKRSIKNLLAVDYIHFTKCEPVPSKMQNIQGSNYFTEFIIEV